MDYLNEVRLNGRLRIDALVYPEYVFFSLSVEKTYARAVKLKDGTEKFGRTSYISCKVYPIKYDPTLLAIAAKLRKDDLVFVKGELVNWVRKVNGKWMDNFYVRISEINQPKTIEEFHREEDLISRRIYPPYAKQPDEEEVPHDEGS
jgi:hypothetical protein